MFIASSRLLFIAFIYFSSVIEVEAKVKIAVTDWPPYYSKDDKNGGQQLALITKVFEKLGDTVEPVWFRTGVGALVKVRANLLDAAAGWECNQDRADDFLFSDPIGYEQTAIFYHKDFDFDWRNIEDLNRNITIGVTAHYAYGEDLQSLLSMDKATVEISGSDRNNFDLLFRREIDLFLLDKNVGLNLIKQANPAISKNIYMHPRPFRQQKVAIRLLVSRKHNNASSFIDKFNQALKELRQQNSLKNIEPEKYDICPKRSNTE